MPDRLVVGLVDPVRVDVELGDEFTVAGEYSDVAVVDEYEDASSAPTHPSEPTIPV